MRCADGIIIPDNIDKSNAYSAMFDQCCAMSNSSPKCDMKATADGAPVRPPYSQVAASFANDGEDALTTQNRCPVGASITHQVCTAWMRLAPNFSSLRTSASISSVSMSRCTRLGWLTICTSMSKPCDESTSRL